MTTTAPTGNQPISTLDEHKQIMEMQKQQSLENMRMQAAQSMQTERLATLSNMMKNAHDSKMTIINNMKG